MRENMKSEKEIDVLARTIWGEARGEGSAGMQAVAAVIMNRAKIAREKGLYWWGNDIVQICRKPFQFSCWNRNDPNYSKLLKIPDSDIFFVTARQIAARALERKIEDPTDGATHYHVAGLSPFWIRGEKPCAVIGHHIFYKLAEV